MNSMNLNRAFSEQEDLGFLHKFMPYDIYHGSLRSLLTYIIGSEATRDKLYSIDYVVCQFAYIDVFGLNEKYRVLEWVV